MQKVLFDPGYSECILGISDNVDFIYNAFVSSNMPLKQKKFQFSILYPKIKKMTEANVAFYLGCLLWAVYLKSMPDGVFEENPCLNMEFSEETAFDETNFLIDFISNKLEKDAKYYINAHYKKDERYIKILETYNEFLKLNKGFINTKTTDDVIIPGNIKKVNEEQIKEIKTTIDNSIKEKDLTKLYTVYDLILE